MADSKRAVLLLSGGLDSTTLLAMAREQGFDVYALTVLYGQRHSAEISAARRVGQRFGVSDHKFADIDLRLWGGSALTDNIEVPKDGVQAGIPITYVPARNTVMLSLALAYAEAIDARDIFIGVNAVDYSGYPDCRPEFVSAFETMANFGTKAGVEGAKLSIHAPIISWTKKQIIEEGLRLGVDYALTHSCYDPGEDGRPCRECDSCRIRIAAFAELGMSDPALS